MTSIEHNVLYRESAQALASQDEALEDDELKAAVRRRADEMMVGPGFGLARLTCRPAYLI